MKPEQFIREYGVEKARALLAQLHNLGCPDDMKITVINGMWHRTSKGFTYPELKRLLESIDQINAFDGGIKEAKEILSRINKHGSKYATLFERPALEQAIHDYESIYGGGDES